MNNTFDHYIKQSKDRIDQALQKYLGNFNSPFSEVDSSNYSNILQQAMLYSLLNGGKRIRATLVYAAYACVANNKNLNTNPNLDKVACALEMIHAYSLIHDDLPAMDDDDLRRGKPSCHKAFDEATAILAGDALQSRAIEVLTELDDCPSSTQIKLIRMLVNAAGQQGMVAGQAIDLQAVNQSIDLTHLETLHRLKTGALIRAAVSMGATLAEASTQQLQFLDAYGEAIGLAFQVQDDILDIESDTDTLGKIQGSDQALNKPTYPSLLGIEGAKQKAKELHCQAIEALITFDDRADHLRGLSNYIISRSY